MAHIHSILLASLAFVLTFCKALLHSSLLGLVTVRAALFICGGSCSWHAAARMLPSR